MIRRETHAVAAAEQMAIIAKEIICFIDLPSLFQDNGHRTTLGECTVGTHLAFGDGLVIALADNKFDLIAGACNVGNHTRWRAPGDEPRGRKCDHDGDCLTIHASTLSQMKCHDSSSL